MGSVLSVMGEVNDIPASDFDERLLTASEVATLNSIANAVVLSACNTAAGAP